MDERALDALADVRLDWRFKGVGPALESWTIGDLRRRRPSLFSGAFSSPVCVVRDAAMRHNVERMASYCRDADVALAPHGKTTMAPQLFALQLAHGAWGITAATISQVRVLRTFGVDRVLLANELVDPSGLVWVAQELAADAGFTFLCYVDSIAGVQRMTSALADVGLSRPVEVLLEVGHTAGRTGCRSTSQAQAVARAVAASRQLRLVGVAGYEGTVTHDGTPEALTLVRRYLGQVRTVTRSLLESGLIATDVDPVVVSAGGSSYFSEVVDVLSGGWPTDRSVMIVLRCGGYVAHDEGLYIDVSPFARQRTESLEPALEVWARVLSQPEPGLALLDAGKRDVSADVALPKLRLRQGAAGDVEQLHGAAVVDLMDQHAYVRLEEGTALAPGDWVGMGIVHPCTSFDKWQLLPVVDDDYRVISALRTFF